MLFRRVVSHEALYGVFCLTIVLLELFQDIVNRLRVFLSPAWASWLGRGFSPMFTLVLSFMPMTVAESKVTCFRAGDLAGMSMQGLWIFESRFLAFDLWPVFSSVRDGF
jgi:hypothetical protein